MSDQLGPLLPAQRVGATAASSCNCLKLNNPFFMTGWPAGVGCPGTLQHSTTVALRYSEPAME